MVGPSGYPKVMLETSALVARGKRERVEVVQKELGRLAKVVFLQVCGRHTTLTPMSSRHRSVEIGAQEFPGAPLQLAWENTQ